MALKVLCNGCGKEIEESEFDINIEEDTSMLGFKDKYCVCKKCVQKILKILEHG